MSFDLVVALLLALGVIALYLAVACHHLKESADSMVLAERAMTAFESSGHAQAYAEAQEAYIEAAEDHLHAWVWPVRMIQKLRSDRTELAQTVQDYRRAQTSAQLQAALADFERMKAERTLGSQPAPKADPHT